MSDKYRLQATARVDPSLVLPAGSGCPSFSFPFEEEVTLAVKNYDEPTLLVDTPVPVDFGAVTNAAVVMISVSNGLKVIAQITSADGVDQAIPVDDTFILLCRSVPVTAINLTRMPATATKVKIFLGEKTI
jgi:hypothetical protein